ncbi:MAG: hypothetical protein H6626_11515 [Pseudobdellovibrionaceae bacterium]|nr:MAG: hypothetical protein H6626_11515 [Pseudobdellovibrionaceae bacterium]
MAYPGCGTKVTQSEDDMRPLVPPGFYEGLTSVGGVNSLDLPEPTDGMAMEGEKLIDNLAEATNLPQHLVLGEIKTLIINQGYSPKTISLDELRLVLADYLQEVLLKARDEFSK